MTIDELNTDLAWRNLVADWHLKLSAPLECGCDDDTADGDFCPASVEWADEEYASRNDPDLHGVPDKWDHSVWVAAWGRNATLIVDNDYRLPKPPENHHWLATRMLLAGRQVIELSLIHFVEDQVSTIARARAWAEPSTVVARARRLLKRIQG